MEEVYIEQTSPKTVFKTILVILFIFGFLIGGYIYFHNSNILRVKRIVVELGDKLPENIEYYVKNKIKNINDYELNLLKVPTTENGIVDEVGKFKYVVTFNSQKKTGILEVKDTKAPKVEVQSLNISLNDDFVLDDFIVKCEDYSNSCNVSLKNESDEKLFKKIGTHEIDLKISDMYGNYVVKTVTLVVSNTDSYLSDKEQDLEVVRVSPEYDDYDGTITLKYDKAVNEDTLDESDEYQPYLELVNTDYSDLMENVYNQEVLTLYNKSNYIVGFAVRLTFNDGSVTYVK